MGPLNWGKGNFWQITHQEAFQWDDKIRANHGDSWCICMWATASLIDAAGCDNVHLDCAATDVAYVMGQYSDGGTDLAPAKECLQKKCPGMAGAMQKVDAALPAIAVSNSHTPLGHVAAFMFAAAIALAVMVHRTLRKAEPVQE